MGAANFYCKVVITSSQLWKVNITWTELFKTRFAIKYLVLIIKQGKKYKVRRGGNLSNTILQQVSENYEPNWLITNDWGDLSSKDLCNNLDVDVTEPN